MVLKETSGESVDPSQLWRRESVQIQISWRKKHLESHQVLF